MTVCDVETIDFASLDHPANDLILTISDHLDWGDTLGHLLALQNKINTYVMFVESGEVYTQWPLAVGRKIKFRVVGKYPLNDEAKEFYEFANETLRKIGLELLFVYLDEG